MLTLSIPRWVLVLGGVLLATAIGALVWILAFAPPHAFRSDCEQTGPNESTCERPIGPGGPVKEPSEPAVIASRTAIPSPASGMVEGEVLGIEVRYPEEWQLDEPNPLGAPHAWTAFVLSRDASLNCTYGDLGECDPSLNPGGVVVWWYTVVPLTFPPEGGEVVNVDGRVARLYVDDDQCDQVTPTGGGLPRHQVDRAAGVTIVSGAEGHVVHGCFRDPDADENFEVFLDFLDSIDFPERHSGI